MNQFKPAGQFHAPRDAAEAALLGAVLLVNDSLDTIHERGVRPEHFRYQPYETLMRGMIALREANRPIDALTLKSRFDSPQSTVSAADIELLTGTVPNLGNLKAYCDIVREGAWFDDTRRALYEAWDCAEAQDRPGLLAALARVDDQHTEAEKDNASEFLDSYENDTQGWGFPYPLLTDMSRGMKPGEVTVLGGWSGMGKSFLLAQMLRHCVKSGARVHEFANEMHGPTRTARVITALTGIPASTIDRKQLDEKQWAAVMDALKRLPYQTTASAGWTVEDYCRRIRKEKWDVCAIDTVTNLPCSRVDEWDRACVMLADAAAQAGTHLIEVSQLNIERDKGRKPPPTGRDLRNTGAWYQRARIVMFVHRDQEEKETGDGQSLWIAQEEGHVRIEKASNGQAATVPVWFNPKWLRFDQLETRDWRQEIAA